MRDDKSGFAVVLAGMVETVFWKGLKVSAGICLIMMSWFLLSVIAVQGNRVSDQKIKKVEANSRTPDLFRQNPSFLKKASTISQKS